MKPSRKIKPVIIEENLADVLEPVSGLVNSATAKPYDDAFFRIKGATSAQVREVQTVDKCFDPYKIEEGFALENAMVGNDDLKVGIFSNTNFPDEDGPPIKQSIAIPMVKDMGDKIAIGLLDGIHDDSEDQEVFVTILDEVKKTGTLDPIRKADMAISQIKVVIDVAGKALKVTSATSHLAGFLGNKCFVIRQNSVSELAGDGEYFSLEKGDIIFIASNTILNKLVENDIGANSAGATDEYRESALATELQAEIKASCVDDKLDQQILFDRIKSLYTQKLIGPEIRKISTYLAYQV